MFSLKSLLFIVAVAGLGAAGLIHRTQLWASAMIALALAVMLLATCRAWFAPQGRVFWGPFALTGAVYLAIVSLQPLVDLHYNLPTTQLVMWGMEKVQTPINVPTTAPAYGSTAYYPAAPAVSYYDPAVSGGGAPMQPPVIVPANPYAAPYGPSQTGLAGEFRFNRDMLFQMATARSSSEGPAAEARVFLWVAQCLWCLLLAFAMGLVCSWLFRGADATMSRPVGP
jgi:hypothetical protein